MLKVGDKVKFKTNMPDDVRFGWTEGMQEELAGTEFIIAEIDKYDIRGHGTTWLVSEDMLERVNKFKEGDTVYYRDEEVTVARYDGSDNNPYLLSNRLWVDEFNIEGSPDTGEFTDVERSILKALVENTLDEFDSYERLRETLLSLHDKL